MNAKYVKWVLITVVVLLIINLLFIILVLNPAILPIFDFTNESISRIATSISGLTTPILTMFSSYLLYLALVRQTEANETQKLKNDIDLVTLLYNQLDVEYSNLSYHTTRTTTKAGVSTRQDISKYSYDALRSICSVFPDYPQKIKTMYAMDAVNSIIASYTLVEDMVRTLKDKKAGKIFEEKIKTFYEFKLKDCLKPLCFNVRDIEENERPKFVFDFFMRK